MARVKTYQRTVNGKRVTVRAHARKGSSGGLLSWLFPARRRQQQREQAAKQQRAYRSGKWMDARTAQAHANGEDGQSEFKRRKAEAARQQQKRSAPKPAASPAVKVNPAPGPKSSPQRSKVRKSMHLELAPKGTKACIACKGSGYDPDIGAPKTCPNCRGWGY